MARKSKKDKEQDKKLDGNETAIIQNMIKNDEQDKKLEKAYDEISGAKDKNFSQDVKIDKNKKASEENTSKINELADKVAKLEAEERRESVAETIQKSIETSKDYRQASTDELQNAKIEALRKESHWNDIDHDAEIKALKRKVNVLLWTTIVNIVLFIVSIVLR